MLRFRSMVSSHNDLIPLKTVYKKRGQLLWAIASEKNFINPDSAAFVTVFAHNLVYAYNKLINPVNKPCKFQEH